MLGVVGSFGLAGCINPFGSDPPREIIRSFLQAVRDGDEETIQALIHPESPLSLTEYNRTFFEQQTFGIGTISIILDEDDEFEEEAVPEEILHDADRAFSFVILQHSQEFYLGSFELRRADTDWYVYDEHCGEWGGEACVLAPEPFPDE